MGYMLDQLMNLMVFLLIVAGISGLFVFEEVIRTGRCTHKSAGTTLLVLGVFQAILLTYQMSILNVPSHDLALVWFWASTNAIVGTSLLIRNRQLQSSKLIPRRSTPPRK